MVVEGGVVLLQGFAELLEEEEVYGEGGGCALGEGVWPPSHPSTIYRWGREGAAPPRSHLGLGRRPRGGGVPPKSSGGPPL